MKIGMFTDTYHPQINGVVTTIDAWRRELQQRGHEVIVIYPKSGPQKKGQYDVPSIEMPFYQGYRLGAPKGEPAALRNLDVVHTHTPFVLGAYGAYIAAKYRIPRIATYHTPVEEYAHYAPLGLLRPTIVKVYLRWERKYMKTAFAITAPTLEAAKSVKNKMGYTPRVLSNGVDTQRFKPLPRNNFRRTRHLPRPFVGFSGRHSYEKHLEDLINIADSIEGTVLICGDGPASKYYRELAKDKKNVVFLGSVKDKEMAAFYSTLDVLVLPSTAETQGLVVLEANACGTPAVGARAAALKNTIQDGVNGYKYRPGDTEDLLVKLNKVYHNRSVLSKKSLAYAKDHSIEKTIDELEKLYKNAHYKRGDNHYRYMYKIPLKIAHVVYKTREISIARKWVRSRLIKSRLNR